MADPSRPVRPGPVRFADAPGRYVFVTILLGITFVALLWIPSYTHITPTLAGFPFFYWYSLLWLLINAASQIIAYQVLVVRRRGAAR